MLTLLQVSSFLDDYTKGIRPFSVVFMTTFIPLRLSPMYFNRFDICDAYYLFFSDYHEGQGSDKYARLSRMLEYFKPSPMLSYDNMSENAQVIYDDLVAAN